MKKKLYFLIFCSISICSYAQIDIFYKAYEDFKKQTQENYNDFRVKANKEYLEFMKQAWEEYQAMPAITRPKDETIPPVIIKKEDLQKPIKSTPIEIEDNILTSPKVEPQPTPIYPIIEDTTKDTQYINFSFYGTLLQVRFSMSQPFTLSNCTEAKVVDLWEKMQKGAIDNTIKDCLELRDNRNLGDWAYLQMLDSLSQACIGQGNEATLLMAYIYCQSGYKMRLGIGDGKLYLLYAISHVIYGKNYYVYEDENFYSYGIDIDRISICKAYFPQEKPLSLILNQSLNLTRNKTAKRTLKSERYPEFEFSVSVNRNLLDFMSNYPSSMVDDNFMTRWAMYANLQLDSEVQHELLPQIKTKLQNVEEKEAVEKLLNWVQTAFVYEYDDVVWGEDRPFFSEETLFYPYCDCEDRAILFTRLVRDLFGLKCILIYYPGHLASAVCFTKETIGDYIVVENEKYVVCDPTFIGASVGMTMPGMDNQKAFVIILN